MKTGHAEIAGGGFAGLTLAIGLARAGWTVTVHERAPAIREIGAGIFLHNNGLQVLEDYDLADEVRLRGIPLKTDTMCDGHGKVIQVRELERRPESRIWSFPRQALIEMLHQAALKQGVDVRVNSEIASIHADGRLTGSNGVVYQGDLVVAADGHLSVARKDLDIPVITRPYRTTSIRFLLRGRDLTPEPGTTEYWSGRRRIAVAACGPAHTYVYLACPRTDERASAVPLNASAWASSFPPLRPLLERLTHEEPYKAMYSYAKLPRWSRGRAVLVGDAAHAMAPTLGQGTNLAMSNTRSLVTFLEYAENVESALSSWERTIRGVTDTTQKWAGRYDAITRSWPPSLAWVRRSIIWAFGASATLNSYLRVADETAPITDVRKIGSSVRGIATTTPTN